MYEERNTIFKNWGVWILKTPSKDPGSCDVVIRGSVSSAVLANLLGMSLNWDSTRYRDRLRQVSLIRIEEGGSIYSSNDLEHQDGNDHSLTDSPDGRPDCTDPFESAFLEPDSCKYIALQFGHEHAASTLEQTMRHLIALHEHSSLRVRFDYGCSEAYAMLLRSVSERVGMT